jgi:D-sedoheptulose 7-phosphate isomerase
MNHIKKELTLTRDLMTEMIENDDFLLNIKLISDVITNCIKNGNKILLCGNGGSAADCQHIAAEFISRFRFDRNPMSAISLTTNTSNLTAIANEYGYEDIFLRQFLGLYKEGDILIGFSASGMSQNILKAFEGAKKINATTIGFFGKSGKEIEKLSTYKINIPSTTTPKIQEGHIAIGHILCGIVEQNVFKNDQK